MLFIISDLDVLVRDEDEIVRAAVARIARPCDLDVLVHDVDVNVRILVAEFGRDKDLDVLVGDKDKDVRDIATRLLSSLTDRGDDAQEASKADDVCTKRDDKGMER